VLRIALAVGGSPTSDPLHSASAAPRRADAAHGLASARRLELAAPLGRRALDQEAAPWSWPAWPSRKARLAASPRQCCSRRARAAAFHCEVQASLLSTYFS
jgi:hypothetical protein